MGDVETTIGVDFYISELDLDGKKIKVRWLPWRVVMAAMEGGDGVP